MVRPQTTESKDAGACADGTQPFVCRRCGTCCTGDGYVNVTDAECERIAEFLDIAVERFLDEYTRRERGFARYLVDGPGADLPCVFLRREPGRPGRCLVQGPAKPRQCEDFPRKWKQAGSDRWCEGLVEEAGRKEAFVGRND